MNFCSNCGKPVRRAIPAGDHKPRFICDSCNTIHYENPRIIVGCLPRWKDKVLLCKRAIDPGRGLWTLPAGFLENDETVEAGALRETLEEANADVRIIRLFSLFSVPIVGQVHLFFLASLNNLDFSPGKETTSLALFHKDEIPWNEIAFSSVRFTLDKYFLQAGGDGDRVYTGAFVDQIVRTK